MIYITILKSSQHSFDQEERIRLSGPLILWFFGSGSIALYLPTHASRYSMLMEMFETGGYGMAVQMPPETERALEDSGEDIERLVFFSDACSQLP